MRISSKTLAAAALLLGLAACNHDSAVAPTTPAAPASFQSQFGTAFAADFNADPNSTPQHPAATDVPALNLSGTPIDN
jgi:hypothetical protein